MDIFKLDGTNAEWLNIGKSYIEAGTHCIAYGVQGVPAVLTHKKSQVNEELCKQMGYVVYEAFFNGGTIVANPGDIAVAHWFKINNNWKEFFVSQFIEWLQSKGLNATYEDNDILVDGYKVCGTCVTRYGRIDFSAIHIGINTKLDDIQKICTKPMKKIPKGLLEYGITTEEVEQWLLKFFKKYE